MAPPNVEAVVLNNNDGVKDTKKSSQFTNYTALENLMVIHLIVIIVIKIFNTEFITMLQCLLHHHVVHYQARNHHVLYL